MFDLNNLKWSLYNPCPIRRTIDFVSAREHREKVLLPISVAVLFLIPPAMNG